MAITHFPLKLVSRRMLAPTVAHLSFVRDDGLPLDYIPGQFVQVHFHYADGTATKRSYSLATQHDHALGAGEAVEIAVSYVAGGAATALFEGLDEGGTIDASGPYGRFCLMPADANQRYLLIGTGTGVTPYRAMLPQLEQLIAERGVEVVLLFGARNPGIPRPAPTVRANYRRPVSADRRAPRLPAILSPRSAYGPDIRCAHQRVDGCAHCWALLPVPPVALAMRADHAPHPRRRAAATSTRGGQHRHRAGVVAVARRAACRSPRRRHPAGVRCMGFAAPHLVRRGRPPERDALKPYPRMRENSAGHRACPSS